MIHWFRTLDNIRARDNIFSLVFYLLTYANFLHFLDNGDRMSKSVRVSFSD